MKSAAFLGDAARIDRVYGQGRRAQVAARTNLYPDVVNAANWEEHRAALRDLEVIWSTWGMLALTPAQLDQLPNLKAVFYAAGSVQGFARPFLERDILVVSAWQANAVPVAEFALAQILLSTKGYFRNAQECRLENGARWRNASHGPGAFGEAVALLGAGAIGRRLINLLQPFALKILVCDPFLSSENAARLGVESVSLSEAFARAYVVSNHLANNPQTAGLLSEPLFASLREGATFINTGRGATVDEPGLVHVLTERPDLTALLDVTEPEPPRPDSPLYTLPNVQLSTHIAGALGDEVIRMADYCLEEFNAWERGEPQRYSVTLGMLETMA